MNSPQNFVIFLTITLLVSIWSIQAQSTSGKIIGFFENDRVEIDLGTLDGLSQGSELNVYGKGISINPATGTTMESENVLLGKLIVIDVNEDRAIAKIIEKSGDLNVSNRVEIIERKSFVSQKSEFNSVDNEQPQTIFQRPEKSRYRKPQSQQPMEQNRSDRPQKTSKIGVSGNLAYNFLGGGGDYNSWADSWNERHDDEGSANKLKNGMDVDGSIHFEIAKDFYITFGSGFFLASLKDEMMWSFGIDSLFFDVNKSFNLIPITFTGVYRIPTNSTISPFIGIGVGYYFGFFSQDYEFDSNFYDPSTGAFYYANEDFKANLNAGDFGFHGLFGFEVGITSNAALTFEGRYRNLKIDGFKGKMKIKNDFMDEEFDATLLYGERIENSDEIDLWIVAEEFEDNFRNDHSNVREGVIDFSAFTIRIGLVVYLRK